MAYYAKVIEHSINDFEVPITTMEIRFPRCVLAEFNTHRDFSRNAASSRAIPTKKIIQEVIDDPYIPVKWGKNQTGMQAFEETDARVNVDTFINIGHGDFEEDDRFIRTLMPYYNVDAWLKARDNAVELATAFMEAGYHKQVVNRLLEPFMWVTVCVTSTKWNNFYGVRDHKDADPAIKVIASMMKEVHDKSTPVLLKADQWHIPYVKVEDRLKHPIEHQIMVSVARCARTSYKTFDGKTSIFDDDIVLYEKLIAAKPAHPSPSEHQATPWNGYRSDVNLWNGNFHDTWMQYRKTLPNEYIS